MVSLWQYNCGNVSIICEDCLHENICLKVSSLGKLDTRTVDDAISASLLRCRFPYDVFLHR